MTLTRLLRTAALCVWPLLAPVLAVNIENFALYLGYSDMLSPLIKANAPILYTAITSNAAWYTAIVLLAFSAGVWAHAFAGRRDRRHLASNPPVATPQIAAGMMKSLIPEKIPTILRLKFLGTDYPVPEMIEEKNILHWYVYEMPRTKASWADECGIVLDSIECLSRMRVIFIMFDNAVDYAQPIIKFTYGKPDTFQVRYWNANYAIVEISGKIPPCEMEFEAKLAS